MRKEGAALRNAMIIGGTVIALLIIGWLMATGVV
jgi:hypothetical protein